MSFIGISPLRRAHGRSAPVHRRCMGVARGGLPRDQRSVPGYNACQRSRCLPLILNENRYQMASLTTLRPSSRPAQPEGREEPERSPVLVLQTHCHLAIHITPYGMLLEPTEKEPRHASAERPSGERHRKVTTAFVAKDVRPARETRTGSSRRRRRVTASAPPVASIRVVRSGSIRSGARQWQRSTAGPDRQFRERGRTTRRQGDEGSRPAATSSPRCSVAVSRRPPVAALGHARPVWSPCAWSCRARCRTGGASCYERAPTRWVRSCTRICAGSTP